MPSIMRWSMQNSTIRKQIPMHFARTSHMRCATKQLFDSSKAMLNLLAIQHTITRPATFAT